MAARDRISPDVQDGPTSRAMTSLLQTVHELVRDQALRPLLDAYQFWAKAQNVDMRTLKAAPNVVIDAGLSNNFFLLLDQNVTIANLENVKPGSIVNLSIDQDATGSRTVAWGSAWKFPGGTPTVTATALAGDQVSGIVIKATRGTATEIRAGITQVHS